MKKFNLSQIMKTAHGLRKNSPSKYVNFSMALKQSWKMAKFTLWSAAQAQEIRAEREAQELQRIIDRKEAQKVDATNKLRREKEVQEQQAKAIEKRLKDEAIARKQGISYNEYQSRLSFQMGYGRGLYCGD